MSKILDIVAVTGLIAVGFILVHFFVGVVIGFVFAM